MSEREERLEALMHAFILAVLALGVLLGLAIARLAELGQCP